MKKPIKSEPLVEGRDYTIEKGFYVFTAYYLKTRGYCCGSGCRNCPYPKPTTNSTLNDGQEEQKS